MYKRRLTITLNEYQVTDWKILYINESTGAVNVVNANVSEYGEPYVSRLITLTQPAPVGSPFIFVNVNDVNVGERYSDGDYIYRITKTENNKLYLHTPLKKNLSIDYNLSKVGNLGVYYVDITFPEPGSYVVLVTNYKYNIINHHVKVIIDNTLTSINNKVDILLSIQSAQNNAQVFV